MPRRIAAAPTAAPQQPMTPTRRQAAAAPSPTTRAWTPTGGARREAPLDRWERLHQPVLEVEERRNPVSARARELAGRVTEGAGSRMSPRLAQDMLDGLTAAGLAEPMWPHFKSMGFQEDEAATIRDQLKSFELGRRTSIIGTERLLPAAKALEGLTAVVRALLDGRAPPLAGLPPAQATVLEKAGRLGRDEQLERAMNLLDLQLESFITDSPVELLDVAPAAVKAGLEASIAAQAFVVSRAADDGELELLTHQGFSAFGQLRELAVIDPVAAQKAGSAFVKALRAAETRTRSRPLD